MLGNLIEHRVVHLDGGHDDKGKAVIGKRFYLRSAHSGDAGEERCPASAPTWPSPKSTDLRLQGRPALKLTASTLLAQLRVEGKLLDEAGQPLPE